MNELQKTLPDCGLKTLVPTACLPEDTVTLLDGGTCLRRDAFADAEGVYYRTEEERDGRDVELVEVVLNRIDEWICDYSTGNTDYVESYICLLDESSYEWAWPIKEWIKDRYTKFDGHIDKLVQSIIEDIDVGYHCEPIYQSNDYASFHGNGCCLYSFGVGEIEEQIDVNEYSILKALHERNRLDDVLDKVNCDLYISRDKQRVKNEETGDFEQVGRNTYKTGCGSPCLYGYTCPGGAWHFVISDIYMAELLTAAIIKEASKV